MRPSVCLLCLAFLAPVASAEPPKGGPPPAPVRVAVVEKETVREGRAFVGSIRALRSADIAAGVAGFIETLDVREGSHVEEGATLATLKKDVIAPQLAAARAALLEIQQEVKELVAGARPEELEASRFRVEEARIGVSTAERRLETAKKLRATKRISADELRDAEDAVTLAQATLARVKASHALLVAGTRAEVVARARARETRQQAEVDRLVALEKRHTVTAPFAGYVVREQTEKGAWVPIGGAVVTLVSLGTVRARFPVLEDDAGAVKVGDAIAVTVPALPGRIFQGKVERIVPEANRTSRSLPVDVTLENETKPEGGVVLVPGMFVHAVLPIGKPAPAHVVPLDALVLGGPQTMVYTIGKDGAAVPVPVETGVILEKRVVIKGPLAPGAQVVVEGNERLRPGQRVQILEK